MLIHKCLTVKLCLVCLHVHPSQEMHARHVLDNGASSIASAQEPLLALTSIQRNLWLC